MTSEQFRFKSKQKSSIGRKNDDQSKKHMAKILNQQYNHKIKISANSYGGKCTLRHTHCTKWKATDVFHRNSMFYR